MRTKNGFGVHLLFCVAGAQGLMRLRHYFDHMVGRDGEFYLGVMLFASAVLVAPFVLLSARLGLPPSPDTPDPDWLTESESRMLGFFCSLVALIALMMTPFVLLNQNATEIPFWWKAASVAYLFVVYFALRQIYAAYFRARRIIRERGFAPKEAKNDMA